MTQNSFSAKKILATHWINIIFYVLLFIHILPVWYLDYFITSDGPAHVYNSTVWDIMLNTPDSETAKFYSHYHYFTKQIVPNWFYQIGIMILTSCFSVFTADKILVSLILLGTALSVRYVIKHIHKENSYLALLVLPFLFQEVFLWGFYNYCFSIVGGYFVIGYWLRHHENLQPINLLILTLGFTCLYFMHLFGVLLSIITIGSLILSNTFINFKAKTWAAVFQPYIHAIIFALPAVLLMGGYMYYMQDSPSNPSGSTLQDLYNVFRDVTVLKVLDPIQEDFWARSLGLTILIGAIVALVMRIRTGKRDITDGFFLAFLLLAYTHFFGAEFIAGGFFMRERLSVLVFMTLIVISSTYLSPKWLKGTVVLVAVVINIAFLGIRLPKFSQANTLAKEYMELAPHIKPNRTIMPMSYNHRGLHLDHSVIAERKFLFLHITGYLAVETSTLNYDNYEANTGYFPLLWHSIHNPYIKGAAEAIEMSPPKLNLNNWTNGGGASPDYLIIAYLEPPYNTQTDLSIYGYLKGHISQSYNQVYLSSHRRISLYKKKGLD